MAQGHGMCQSEAARDATEGTGGVEFCPLRSAPHPWMAALGKGNFSRGGLGLNKTWPRMWVPWRRCNCQSQKGSKNPSPASGRGVKLFTVVGPADPVPVSALRPK